MHYIYLTETLYSLKQMKYNRNFYKTNSASLEQQPGTLESPRQ